MYLHLKMAEILGKLLNEDLSVNDVLNWYKCPTKQANIGGYSNLGLREDFVPFFINYLRDQTAHLLCHGPPSLASPARVTPGKLLVKAPPQPPNPKKNEGHTQSCGRVDEGKPNQLPRCRRSSKKRVNLFSSPQSTDTSDISSVSFSSSFSSIDNTSLLSNNSITSLENDRSHRRAPFKHEESMNSSDRVDFLYKGGHHRSKRSPHIRNTSRGNERSDFKLGEFVSFSTSTPNTTPHSKSRRSDHSSSKTRTSFNKQDRSGTAETSPRYNIENVNDFPPVSNSSPSPANPRRITPTALNSSTSHSQNVTFSPSVFNQSTDALDSSEQSSSFHLSPVQEEKDKKSFEEERLLLKKMRNWSTAPSIKQTIVTPTKRNRLGSLTGMETDIIFPDESKVTSQAKLEVLAKIYSWILHDCLVPNLAVELYFLIQLVTAKGAVQETTSIKAKQKVEDMNYLVSVHNVVYFAIEVLCSLKSQLKLLDKSTLRLLADCSSIVRFRQTFQLELLALCEEPSISPMDNITSSPPIQAVPFLADTDNRKNFPSDKSFHTFKKQRDKFYELLREWQSNHCKPGWSFDEKMGGRVREFIHLTTDVANYAHFARLFSSQLVRMCQGDHRLAENDEGRELGLLGDLKRTNPEKFKRLEERFFTPSTSGGPCPAPSFQGYQEFFKDFIIAAESFTFNQHLMNYLAIKITELNDGFQLYNTEQETPYTTSLDDEQREQFISCLLALRVLAKFFGFLTFLPYIGSSHLPEDMKHEMLLIRKKTVPLIDVVTCLHNAVMKQRLVLVVPWMIEFLSMMDSCAIHLQLYTSILKDLIGIYRMVASFEPSLCPPFNRFFLLLILGWLFEIPSLGGNLFFTLSEEDQKCAHLLETHPDAALDSLPLLDQKTIYMCCPYLGDIRVLLAEASLGIQSKSTPMKKITPIAADVPETSTATTDKVPSSTNIQMELEKNFFHTNSPSLKKTVEFIAHRVSSNCIKQIDTLLLVTSRKDVESKIAEVIRHQNLDHAEGSKLQRKLNDLKQLARKTGDDICQTAIHKANEMAEEFVKSKCQTSMSSLLAEETSRHVIDVASSIASRNALERVDKWVKKQIPAALQNEVQTALLKFGKEPVKKTSASDTSQRRTTSEHDESAPSPSALIQSLKDISRCLITKKGSPKELVRRFKNVLSMTSVVLHRRQDMTPVALTSIQALIKDLLILVIVHLPDSLLGDTQTVVTAQQDMSLFYQTDGVFEPQHIKQQSDVINCQTSIDKDFAKIDPAFDVTTASQTSRDMSAWLGHTIQADVSASRCGVKNETISVLPKDNDVQKPVREMILNVEHKYDQDVPNSQGKLFTHNTRTMLEWFLHLLIIPKIGNIQVENLLSPKTFFLLRNSPDHSKSWDCVRTIVQVILEGGCMQIKDLHEHINRLESADISQYWKGKLDEFKTSDWGAGTL